MILFLHFNSFDDSDWEFPVSSEINTLRDLSFRSRADKTGPLYGRYHRSPGHVNEVSLRPMESGDAQTVGRENPWYIEQFRMH